MKTTPPKSATIRISLATGIMGVVIGLTSTIAAPGSPIDTMGLIAGFLLTTFSTATLHTGNLIRKF